MPIFEYKCLKYNHVFEKHFKITDNVPKTINCELCKKYKAEKQFPTGGSFILKGRGFHSNDYE